MPESRSSKSKPFGLFERRVARKYMGASREQGGVRVVSLISFFGIMLAVAALIIIMSIMNGFRSELLSRILGAQGHIYVQSRLVEPSAEAFDQAMEDIRAIPGVTSVEPVFYSAAFITSDGKGAGAYVKGVDPAILKQQDYIIDGLLGSSEITNFGEGELGGDGILIGYALANEIQGYPGKQVGILSSAVTSSPFGNTPRRKAYEVLGVVNHGYYPMDQAYVYMPLEQAELLFRANPADIQIEVRVEDPENATRYARMIEDTVAIPVGVEDWIQRNATIASSLNLERTMMRLILMVVVAITALNIISGLVMLVKNKGRDIAILRTMGASRGSILRIFLMVGSAIGFLGTIAGLVLGVLFCLNIDTIQNVVETVFGVTVFPSDVYLLSGLPAEIDWKEVAFITVWGFLMSIIATFLPARTASRLDPVEALRNE